MGNGAEEYHKLRQSLGMLRFGTTVQMGDLVFLINAHPKCQKASYCVCVDVLV